MAPSKIGLMKLEKMYNEAKNKGIKNFLSEDPKKLILLRLGKGYSLKKLGKEIGFSYVTISEIERGKRKTINKKLLQRVTKKFKTMPSFENIVENYKNITEISKGGQIQAMKRAEKAELTKEEKEVFERLKNVKIEIKPHKTFQTSIGPVNVDFMINSNIIVEVTKSKRRQKLESLDLRAIKLKQKIDGLKTVVIVPNGLSKTLKQRLEDFDYIFEMRQLDNFIDVLNSQHH
jgi:transcriptional regulator with XRE-family HTH domain